MFYIARTYFCSFSGAGERAAYDFGRFWKTPIIHMDNSRQIFGPGTDILNGPLYACSYANCVVIERLYSYIHSMPYAYQLPIRYSFDFLLKMVWHRIPK